MKGLIFSELMHWVEASHGPAIVDLMITRSRVPNDGAYTSVGNYPHEEALALLVALAEHTGNSVAELAQGYGHWLAGRFVVLYPELVGMYQSTPSLLAGVGAHIHKEVVKLYPEARPPSVEVAGDANRLALHYHSHRPFADIAHGLIEGFLAHFGDDMAIRREDIAADGTAATFHLARR